MPSDPIDRIEWRLAGELNANDYNPNIVFGPELRLLELSLVRTGWVQPILITRADATIIDGYHRVRLAQDSKALRKKYQGKVPCAVLEIDRAAAMMLTIRMNRAKGSHVAVRMSEIIHELVDQHGVDPQQIAVEIGATPEEITLLYQDGVFKMKNIENYAYSKAWYPIETGKASKAP
jgi:ParB-like chromosome segregation protein Spo0J